MLASQIKHSLRAFKRQKAYMIINIIGLAIGIASSVLISLYVYHEMGYDSFNEKKEQLYRVNLMDNIGGQGGNMWATASIVGPTVAEEFPEVEAFMRIAPAGGSVIKINNQSFFLSRFRPIVVLKGAVQSGLKNVRLRKILVIKECISSWWIVIFRFLFRKSCTNKRRLLDLIF